MQGRRAFSSSAVVALALLAAAPARAELPVPVSVVRADTTIAALTPPGGTAPTLTASSGATAYVSFHVDGLPIPPQRALLRLRVTDGGGQTTVTRTQAGWAEDTATAPAAIGGTVATLATAATGQDAVYDVTSAVTASGDVSFKIAGSLDGVSFGSRESLTPPRLELTTRTPAQELAWRLSSPTAATASRYQATDTAGGTLDALKIVQDTADGGYLGVWHALEGGRFVARVGTSTDLLHWQRRADLDEHASQPTLALLPGGGVLVALEADAADGNHLRFRRYPTVAALLAAQPDATFDAPRTLAPTAEGTPSIRAAEVGAQRVDVAFHYYRQQDVDRQATGTLTGLGTPAASWTTQVDAARNTLFEALGVNGNLGDRDDLFFRGHQFTLHEGQLTKDDFGSWREFLYDAETQSAARLPVVTAKGSPSLGNGTATVLLAPSGRPALAITYFIFGTGAAAGEPGELVFYSEFDDAPPPSPPPPTTTTTTTTTPPPPTTITTTTTPPPPPPPVTQAVARAAVRAALDAARLPVVHASRVLRDGRYRFTAALPAGDVLVQLWSARPPSFTGTRAQAASTVPRLIAAQARHLGVAVAARLSLKLVHGGTVAMRRAVRRNRTLVLRAVVTTGGGLQVVRDRRVALRR